MVTHRRFELRTIALKVRCSTCWASESLAGVAGFEPTNARIKIWCLTAWRYPYPAQSIISLHKTFCNKINRFFANNLFALQIPIKSSFFGLYQTPKRRWRHYGVNSGIRSAWPMPHSCTAQANNCLSIRPYKSLRYHAWAGSQFTELFAFLPVRIR